MALINGSACRDTSIDPPASSPSQAVIGFTVAELARRFRVGEDKIRRWIKAGELVALNTATTLCSKPRFVVTPDALAAFERRRTVGPPPKAQRRRRRQEAIDFYPD